MYDLHIWSSNAVWCDNVWVTVTNKKDFWVDTVRSLDVDVSGLVQKHKDNILDMITSEQVKSEVRFELRKIATDIFAA